MKENDPPVSFAKVDATVETELASKYEVSGYPTLKVFRKGEAHDYDGPREEEGIVHLVLLCLSLCTFLQGLGVFVICFIVLTRSQTRVFSTSPIIQKFDLSFV